jgi:amidase/6-aminohexanoate-cyclic-dimer hydrolase
MGPKQFEGWNGLSAHHAVTISVRDSAALLDVSSGPELGAPYYAPPQQRPFLMEVGADPGELRIALIADSPSGTPVDSECRKAATEAAKLCEDLGHKVEEVPWPVDPEIMRGAFLTIVNVSVAKALDEAATPLGRAVTDQDVEPVTWAMARQGRDVSSVAYSRAIATIHQIGFTMAKFQQTYDVILNPTLGKPPVQLGLLSLSPTDMRTFMKEITEFSPFTAIYNVTGQPSMSAPLHWTSDGLPVGVMFSARFGDEATLFRLASQLEKAKPWAGMTPKL